jgi:tellurite resistance protein
MSKKPTKVELDTYAAAVRKELSVPRQSDVFKAAVEAGYLAATTDGKLDDDERRAIVTAVEILSQGAVIEWEADSLVEEVAKATGKPEERAKALGARLKELGQPEAGLLFGAFVAQATAGIDKNEEKILKAIGKAAGVADKRVREILKTVGAESAD